VGSLRGGRPVGVSHTSAMTTSEGEDRIDDFSVGSCVSEIAL